MIAQFTSALVSVRLVEAENFDRRLGRGVSQNFQPLLRRQSKFQTSSACVCLHYGTNMSCVNLGWCESELCKNMMTCLRYSMN